MWIRKQRPMIGVRFLILIFCVTSVLLVVRAEGQQKQQTAVSARQIIVLLDVNPNQKNVWDTEQTVAKGVIRKFNQPQNEFFIVTFGFQNAILLKSNLNADEALETIAEISLESIRVKTNSQFLYNALDMSFAYFSKDTNSKLLFVISEGNDYANRQTFHRAISRAKQLGAVCNVAIVADHPLYGSKSIQRYGFYLHRLAGKTHGFYAEIGNEKQAIRHIERLTKRFNL